MATAFSKIRSNIAAIKGDHLKTRPDPLTGSLDQTAAAGPTMSS